MVISVPKSDIQTSDRPKPHGVLIDTRYPNVGQAPNHALAPTRPSWGERSNRPPTEEGAKLSMCNPLPPVNALAPCRQANYNRPHKETIPKIIVSVVVGSFCRKCSVVDINALAVRQSRRCPWHGRTPLYDAWCGLVVVPSLSGGNHKPAPCILYVDIVHGATVAHPCRSMASR